MIPYREFSSKIEDNFENAKEAGATVLRNYGNFLKYQDKTFQDVQKQSIAVLFAKPKNKHIYPITIDIAVHEDIHILDIIESDNKILNKLLYVFSSLCKEIHALKNEAKEKHYYFLAFYIENFRESNMIPEEAISELIENLLSLSVFAKRCQDVVVNLCNQLCELFICNLINLKGAKLNYIISHLCDILLVLVTLDHLVCSSSLQNHWMTYRKVKKGLHHNPNKYNQTIENLNSIDVVLNTIEDRVLSDNIFQNCLDALTSIKAKLAVKNGLQITEEFSTYLKVCLLELEKSTLDTYESSSVILWVKVNALFVFHYSVFGNTDKRVFKTLLEANIKAHSVPLFGSVIWYPEQFLLRYVNALCSNTKISHTLSKARQTYISTKKQTLRRDAYNAQLQSVKWSLDMMQTFGIGEANLTAAQLNHRMTLLSQGVKFASQINFILICYTNLHISQGLPMTKNTLMVICKLVEILKGLQTIFHNNYASIAASIDLIVKHVSYQIISKLIIAKKTLMSDKNYGKQRLDELTSIVIAERVLSGPITLQRRIAANVCMSLIPIQAFHEDGYSKIIALLDSIERIVNIQGKMDSLSNCSFLYWNKSIIPFYFQSVLTTKKDMQGINVFFGALNDCSQALTVFKKCIASKDSSDYFYNEINNTFNETILKPLGQQIETNLRLHTHSHLQLDSMNPFVVPVNDYSPLLKMDLIKFNSNCISVCGGIEHYLSYMFYNLTTVVLHDWKTYGEMRQLAYFKFGLRTVEDNLPTQTLEQGLDSLDIMRNIHVFVSKYAYNLNNQIFIEQSSNKKTLNTINITHIANSIRTHGAGIMNTTVNFTYQFLRKKFFAFSQFMYDEQIKSRLTKDMRQFRESGVDTEQMYSYKRAEKFNKGIRNLGLNEDGQSCLDLFRILITHIGNAMGYVRMVRSGGLHCCSNASAFLPSLEEDISYEELLSEQSVDDTMKDAIRNLETTINNLTMNFSHGTKYFKLLIDVFAPVFRNPDHIHLKSFFMIIPPLTLNFVENMLLCKDKMNKKNTTGAAFTDDGFAMGLAYILRLLDQDQGMDSLHWFKSVNKHIAQERKQVEEQLAKGTTHIHQALALTQKKLTVLEQEFQLLYFSFSSARIFFQ